MFASVLINTSLVWNKLGYMEGLGIYDSWENFVKHKVRSTHWRVAALKSRNRGREFVKSVFKLTNLFSKAQCLFLINEPVDSFAAVRNTGYRFDFHLVKISPADQLKYFFHPADTRLLFNLFVSFFPRVVLHIKDHKANAKQKKYNILFMFL